MRDQVWAIRKICADTFSAFAEKCSKKTRIEVLTPCFTKLLDDHSRWVKLSAYKSLGSFIYTFVDKKNESEPAGEKGSGEADSDASAEYSDFMYWRNSLPKLDEDGGTSTTGDKTPSTPTNVKDLSQNQNSNISIYSSSGSLNIYSQLQQEHQEQLEQKAFDINELSETLKQVRLSTSVARQRRVKWVISCTHETRSYFILTGHCTAHTAQLLHLNGRSERSEQLGR